MEHYDSLQGMPLAMAYVPWQTWQNVFDGAKGLEQGSIFEELIFPFEYAGPGCRNIGNCRHRSSSCRQMNSRQNMNMCRSRQPEFPTAREQRMCEKRRDCSCQEMTEKN